MILNLEKCRYNTAIFPTDWRYSASLLGLKKYLDYYDFEYEKYTVGYNSEFIQKKDDLMGMEGILYNKEDITEEKDLLYAETNWNIDFQHIRIEEKLKQDDFNDDEIKEINSLLNGSESNTILKKLFKDVRFDGKNKIHISEMIRENRLDIIRETYRNKLFMYKNFANKSLLFTSSNDHCRLVGYNIDENRKSKSVSYFFTKKTFVQNDCLEFDFIPFAFSKTRDAIFINNNYSVDLLEQTFNELNQSLDKISNFKNSNMMTSLLKMLAKSSGFIKYDVEVIMKNQGKDYFENVYLRENSISAMARIENKIDLMNFKYELSKDYWFDLQEEITNICLNNLKFDGLIEFMFKIRDQDNVNKSYVKKIIDYLIEFNFYMKGEEKMDKIQNCEILREDIEKAKKCAFLVAKTLPENKVKSYRQKLISALVFHDYDRVCEILLQLSGFSDISMPFAYKIYENPANAKNLAFAFANGLEKIENSSEK